MKTKRDEKKSCINSRTQGKTRRYERENRQTKRKRDKAKEKTLNQMGVNGKSRESTRKTKTKTTK